MERFKLIIAVLLAGILLFCACNNANQAANRSMPTPPPPGPEVGKWHGSCRLSDLDTGGMAQEDVALLSMISGNIMFEVDVEFCEDFTFSYVINREAMSQSISQALGWAISLFSGYDLSMFVDRLVEAALGSDFKTSDFGTYTTEDNKVVCRTESGETIYFRMIAGKLIQMDENGNDTLIFEKTGN